MLSHLSHKRELSALSKGNGLMNAGVEFECFADNQRAYSLQGQPFLAPAGSQRATLQPYRKHKLVMPKTYVTRRGQMVLFTAPQDMVIGKSCLLHQREIISRKVADKFSTTTQLAESTFKYETERDSGISDSENTSTEDQPITGAGHFTHVYLKNLQDITKKARDQAKDCTVEDVEDKAADGFKESESEIPECDSGIGHSHIPSSGRMSALSQTSESTVIIVPDGTEQSQSVTDLGLGEGYERNPDAEKQPDWKQLLGIDLPVGAAAGTSTTAKKRLSRTKKQKSPCKGAEKQAKISHQSSDREDKQAGKSKRKHRKRVDVQDVVEEPSATEKAQLESPMVGQQQLQPDLEEQIQVTAINIAAEETQQRSSASNRAARLEERRAEIERKRREKQELVALKRQEEEERQRLIEQVVQSSDLTPAPSVADPAISDKEVPAPQSHVVSYNIEKHESCNTEKLRAELEQIKLRERRLMLAYEGEKIANSLSEDMNVAEDAITTAQNLRNEVLADSVMTYSPEAAREDQKAQAEAAWKKGSEIQKEHNYRARLELGTQRRYQSISRPHVFSYFRYVSPADKPDKKTNKRRGKPRRRT